MEITAEQVGADSQAVTAMCVLWGLEIFPYKDFKHTQDDIKVDLVRLLVDSMRNKG